jgi:hypothetical protein
VARASKYSRAIHGDYQSGGTVQSRKQAVHNRVVSCNSFSIAPASNKQGLPNFDFTAENHKSTRASALFFSLHESSDLLYFGGLMVLLRRKKGFQHKLHCSSVSSFYLKKQGKSWDG